MSQRIFGQYKGERPFEKEIDPWHPLVTGLQAFFPIEEGGGANIYDLVSGLAMASQNFGSTNPWISTGSVSGLNCNGNNFGFQANLPPRLQLALPISLACGLRCLGTPSSSCSVWGVAYDAAYDSPYNSYQFFYSGSAWTLGYNSANTNQTLSSSQAAVTGVDIVLSATLTATTQAIYYQGQVKGSGSASISNPTYGSPAVLQFGLPSLLFYDLASVVCWGAIWSRALTVGEHAEIGSNIYAIRQIYQQQRPRIFVIPISASTGSSALLGI